MQLNYKNVKILEDWQRDVYINERFGLIIYQEINFSHISVLTSRIELRLYYVSPYYYVVAPFCVSEFYKSIPMVVCDDIAKISLFLRLIRYDFTATQKRRSAKATWFFRLVRRFPARRTCLKGRYAKGGLSRRGWESVPLVHLFLCVRSEGRIMDCTDRYLCYKALSEYHRFLDKKKRV